MQAPPANFAIPGMRIPNYRNSARRAIRLVGLGAVGTEMVRVVARRGLSNVAIVTTSAPAGWTELAGDGADLDLNLIVIVCGQGDEHLIRPAAGRPDMPVTVVVVQTAGNMMVASEPDIVRDPNLARARAFSDLFVTTSDRDYVSELIDNLAS